MRKEMHDKKNARAEQSDESKISAFGWIIRKIYGLCAVMLGIVFLLNSPMMNNVFVSAEWFMRFCSYVMFVGLIDIIQIVIDRHRGALFLIGGFIINTANLVIAVLTISSFYLADIQMGALGWPNFYYVAGGILLAGNLAWLFLGE